MIGFKLNENTGKYSVTGELSEEQILTMANAIAKRKLAPVSLSLNLMMLKRTCERYIKLMIMKFLVCYTLITSISFWKWKYCSKGQLILPRFTRGSA